MSWVECHVNVAFRDKENRMSRYFKMELINKTLFKIKVEIIPLHGLKKFFIYSHFTEHMHLVSNKLFHM
jgi:hypothetical protein